MHIPVSEPDGAKFCLAGAHHTPPQTLVRNAPTKTHRARAPGAVHRRPEAR